MAEEEEKLDLYDVCEELEEAAELSNDELGEWWAALTNIHPAVVNCGSEKFREAWEEQVRDEHQRLRTEFMIEEEEVVAPTYRRRTLKYRDE